MFKNLLLFLVVFSSISCSNRPIYSIVKTDYFTYEKVKVKIKSANSNFYFKGYISFSNIDTSFCFKFFGPLGISLFEGVLDDSLIVHDFYNEKIYYDLLKSFKSKEGFVLSSRSLFELISFNDSAFSNSVCHINSNVLFDKKIDIFNRKHVYNFYQIGDSLNVNVYFYFKKGLASKLIFSNGYDSVELLVLNISTRRKKCNFVIN